MENFLLKVSTPSMIISPRFLPAGVSSESHLPRTRGAMSENLSHFLFRIWSKNRQGLASSPRLVVFTIYIRLSPCCIRAENLRAFFSDSVSGSMYLLPTAGTFQSCSMPRKMTTGLSTYTELWQSARSTPVRSFSGISSLCFSSFTLSTAYLSSDSLSGVTVLSSMPRLFRTVPTLDLPVGSHMASITSSKVIPS